jgi:uncharacterized phage-associated protein
MTAIKLQKLVYYCQAWSLVWDEKPLFQEVVQAWPNGPVIPRLLQEHRKSFKVHKIGRGDPSRLTKIQVETVDAVLKFYGEKSSQWLVELSTMEKPWREARGELGPDDSVVMEIRHSAMAEYYSSLLTCDCAKTKGVESMESENQKIARELTEMILMTFWKNPDRVKDHLEEWLLELLENKDKQELEIRQENLAKATHTCSAEGSCVYKMPIPKVFEALPESPPLLLVASVVYVRADKAESLMGKIEPKDVE